MRPFRFRLISLKLLCAAGFSCWLACGAHADNAAEAVGQVIWDYAVGERTTISRYGNWLGPGWWGGSELADRAGMLPPVDDLDAVAQKHDFGYELAEKLGKGRPNVEAYYKAIADMIAVRDTMALNPDPTKWTHPAANPDQARIFMDRLRIGFTYYQQRMHELKARLPNAPADITDPEVLNGVIEGILDEKLLEARMLIRISQWEKDYAKWQAAKKAQGTAGHGGQGQQSSSNAQTSADGSQVKPLDEASLLQSICRCSSSCTARLYYSITPVPESPSCNDLSSGPCVCSGMGCMRSVMSPDCIVKAHHDAMGRRLNVAEVMRFIEKSHRSKAAAPAPGSIPVLVRKGEALEVFITPPGKEPEKWLWQAMDDVTFRATRLSPGTVQATEVIKLREPSLGHLVFVRSNGDRILAVRDLMNGGFSGGIADGVPEGTTIGARLTTDPHPQAASPQEEDEPATPRGSGYQLYFDGKLVSGPDAADYTREQAQENCDWNMQTKPRIHIRCVYNGKLLSERDSQAPRGSGYQLYFDGKLVSGPDAAGYTREQAQENCDWNMQTKPQIHIRCVYNGKLFSERNSQAPQGSGYQLYFDGKLVSGPDAAYYTREQAHENCDWNRRTKPHIEVHCVYNGQPLRK